MKRWGNIITREHVSHDFCVSCILKAAFRKKKRRSVRRILHKVDYYADRIREMVLEETFYPNEYAYDIRIEHGKKRHLQKPKFYPDQIIHHILIELLQPRLRRRIDRHACASIPVRGQKEALRLLKKWVQRIGSKSGHKADCKYCLKCDIRHCFENIKPEIIEHTFRDFIKDEKYMRLFNLVIYSTDSLPLGNYMSAWILNVMLKHMDNALQQEPCVTHYLRYMDDFVLFSSNKRKLHQVRKIIENELERLELNLKANWQLFPVKDRGVDMIGYRVFPNVTILRKGNLGRIRRRAVKMSKRHYFTEHESQSMMSLLGQLRHCHAGNNYRFVGNLVNVNNLRKIISNASKERMNSNGHISKISRQLEFLNGY